MVNVNESTPNTTPLPNGSSTHGYLDTLSSSLTPPSTTTEKRRHLVLERGDRLDDSEEDDDEEGLPPPLPQKPPPSSDSASSTTPPDLLDEDTPPLDSILPRASSGFSIGSYETHSESFTRIIEPPEAFSTSSVVTSSLVLPKTIEEIPRNSKELSRSLSESRTVREGFRRVRSNPSIASNKVMSVISSKKASSDSPPRDIKRTSSQDVGLVDEYVVKLKSTEN